MTALSSKKLPRIIPHLNQEKKRTTRIRKIVRGTSTSNPDNNEIPENLFDVLPFRNIELGDQVEKRPYIVMTYLPNGTYHKLKRKCEKAGINLVTRPGRKLKDILCAPNKTRHHSKDKPGIYRL